MTQKEFLLQHLTEGKTYPKILKENPDIKREQLTTWWNIGEAIRETIKKSNQLFNSRIGKDEFIEFEKDGKRAFFEWYEKQPRKCAYCGIEEEKLQQLYDKENGVFKSKRKRGRSLEFERMDALKNDYSKKNCVLVCYPCNNHKSDYISSDEHIEYFAPAIRQFLEDKFLEMNDNR